MTSPHIKHYPSLAAPQRRAWLRCGVAGHGRGDTLLLEPSDEARGSGVRGDIDPARVLLCDHDGRRAERIAIVLRRCGVEVASVFHPGALRTELSRGAAAVVVVAVDSGWGDFDGDALDVMTAARGSQCRVAIGVPQSQQGQGLVVEADVHQSHTPGAPVHKVVQCVYKALRRQVQ